MGRASGRALKPARPEPFLPGPARPKPDPKSPKARGLFSGFFFGKNTTILVVKIMKKCMKMTEKGHRSWRYFKVSIN